MLNHESTSPYPPSDSATRAASVLGMGLRPNDDAALLSVDALYPTVLFSNHYNARGVTNTQFYQEWQCRSS